MGNELKIAKQNGHEPGHLFEGYIDRFGKIMTPVCFCKKCNQALTYKDIYTDKILGAYNKSCSK